MLWLLNIQRMRKFPICNNIIDVGFYDEYFFISKGFIIIENDFP